MVDKQKQEKVQKLKKKKGGGKETNQKELSEPFRELTLVKDEDKNEPGGPRARGTCN